MVVVVVVVGLEWVSDLEGSSCLMRGLVGSRLDLVVVM